MQPPSNSDPVVPPPPVAYPTGDPRSVVYYVETFLSIVDSGITGQVFAFWIGVIRTELGSITDEVTRAEAMRLLTEVDKVGAWFSHEAQRPGEALPLILSPIRKLMEYLKHAGQPATAPNLPDATMAMVPRQPTAEGQRRSLR
jgi:hypothetical protein